MLILELTNIIVRVSVDHSEMVVATRTLDERRVSPPTGGSAAHRRVSFRLDRLMAGASTEPTATTDQKYGQLPREACIDNVDRSRSMG
jgi:hypothetical protein